MSEQLLHTEEILEILNKTEGVAATLKDRIAGVMNSGIPIQQIEAIKPFESGLKFELGDWVVTVTAVNDEGNVNLLLLYHHIDTDELIDRLGTVDLGGFEIEVTNKLAHGGLIQRDKRAMSVVYDTILETIYTVKIFSCHTEYFNEIIRRINHTISEGDLKIL